MSLQRAWVGIVACVVLGSCASTPPAPKTEPAAPQPAPADKALLWMRTSAEYEAVCRQVFLQAAGALLLDTAADGAACTKPRAVIMDLDETVLDNSLFSIWTEVHPFPPAEFGRAWEYWVRTHDGTARLVPGAKLFIDTARAKGIEVVFISNRPENLRAETIATLKRLGVAPAAPVERTVLLYDGKSSGKEPRRARTAQSYCIIALVGDNLADMAERYEARKTPGYAARTAQVEKDDAQWGVRWFALPNPYYGDWRNGLKQADIDAIRAEAPPPMPK